MTVLDPDTGPLARPYPPPLLAAHVPDTDPPKLAVAATLPSTAKPISPLAMSNHATRSTVLPASEAAGIEAILVWPIAEKISCKISCPPARPKNIPLLRLPISKTMPSAIRAGN